MTLTRFREGDVGILPSTLEIFPTDEEVLWGKIAETAGRGAHVCLSLDLEGKLTKEQMENELRPALNLCGIIIEQFEKDRTLPVSSREELQKRGIYESLHKIVVEEGKIFSSDEEMKSWAEGTRTFLDQTARLGRIPEPDKERLLAIQDTFVRIQAAYIYKQFEQLERRRSRGL